MTVIRDRIIQVVNVALALVACVFALGMVAALGYAGWQWLLTDDSPGWSIFTAVVFLGVALVFRFLAQLDRYEYVPAPTRRGHARRRTRKA